MSERWTRTERKRERNVNDERTMNVFIRKVSGIFLTLYFTQNLVGIYMYELLNFVILFKRIYISSTTGRRETKITCRHYIYAEYDEYDNSW